MDFVSTYVQPFGTLFAVLLSVWTFIQSPSRKNADEIEKMRNALNSEIGKIRDEIKVVDDKADLVGGRVSTIETVMKHMPDKDDLHRLEMTLERMTSHIEILSSKLESVEGLSRRVQAMLVSVGAKGAES